MVPLGNSTDLNSNVESPCPGNTSDQDVQFMDEILDPGTSHTNSSTCPMYFSTFKCIQVHQAM
ncbi:hypothetical protein KUF71_003629 [Frankliniella fusca]|uniref:Uncharacterized protein n=1 Tax=Frankliniella fusca TaxID=407009 RepID=A0AAE1HX82_9NEOP|nr:hypothetical protein KUF71_003629 [Frankliniella fusca]